MPVGLTYGEWRCLECDDHIERGAENIAKLERARDEYEAACDALGDERRDEPLEPDPDARWDARCDRDAA